MNKKIIVVVTAVLVVAITVFAQAADHGHQHRYLQHQEAKAAAEPADALACLTPTEQSKTGYDPAAVDVNRLVTHLPLLTIDTGGEEIPGEPYYDGQSLKHYTTAANGENTITATLTAYDQAGELHSLGSQPTFSSAIKLRIRGNSSRWFDKKSYAIRTVNDDGSDNDYPLLGMDEHREWALHGPFLDKSLMRNYLGMNLSGMIMDYAPDVRFCELVVNGEYRGLYLLMETIDKGKGRIDISGPNDKTGITGYIVQFDRIGEDQAASPMALDNFISYARILRPNAQVILEYPGEANVTEKVRRYVELDLSTMEKALYSFDYDTSRYGYQRNLDQGEFTDYFILMELLEMQDTGSLSTFYYRDINAKIKPCVWDFNNCCDNFSDNADNDYQIRQFVCVQAPWFWMLVKDEDFVEGVIARYHLLRRTTFADERLAAFIDDTVAYLGNAVERNDAVWGYSFDAATLDNRNKLLHPYERNATSFDGALSQHKSALLGRAQWLDQHIEVLRQYCHESAVKKYNH